jgi:hypothetical protein
MTDNGSAHQHVGLARRVIRRVRRNHALEHATMHILAATNKDSGIVGRSALGGFHIYGEVPTERVMGAAQEGLRRLKAGQRHLAVHPNCGTNVVLAGGLAGLGAFLVLGTRRRSLWERLLLLPLACAAATLGILLAQPLGPLVQARLSTKPDLGNLRITRATRTRRAGILDHHVHTEA